MEPSGSRPGGNKKTSCAMSSRRQEENQRKLHGGYQTSIVDGVLGEGLWDFGIFVFVKAGMAIGELSKIRGVYKSLRHLLNRCLVV